MTDILGWTALLAVLGHTLLLALRNRSIAVALLVAYGARAAATLSHFYVVPLPDGTADAATFERLAWQWSQGRFLDTLAHFPGPTTDFYPWLLSLLYAATDRSLLMAQATSVMAGVLGVFFAWRFAQELWDERSARKVVWIMALFPTVVQYSALTMREAWVVLFFILGLISIVRWARDGGLQPIATGIAWLVAAIFFHGGIFVVILVFLGLIVLHALRRLLAGLPKGRVGAISLVSLTVAVSGIGIYVGGGFSVPKLGAAAKATDIQLIISHIQHQQSKDDAGARYGSWQVPSHPADLLWIAPAKSVYFLFSPFPWDLRKPAHVIGLFDALFYVGLAFLAWRQRHSIWTDPGGRAVLLVLAGAVLVFGVGTSNFGTALRHRAKFVVALIALVGPRLPRIVLNKRDKKTEAPTAFVAKKTRPIPVTSKWLPL